MKKRFIVLLFFIGVSVANLQAQLSNELSILPLLNEGESRYKELVEKVTWPTWLQLQQSTIIVLVATLLITAIVWAMDLIAQSALHFIYSLI